MMFLNGAGKYYSQAEHSNKITSVRRSTDGNENAKERRRCKNEDDKEDTGSM